MISRVHILAVTVNRKSYAFSAKNLPSLGAGCAAKNGILYVPYSTLRLEKCGKNNY